MPNNDGVLEHVSSVMEISEARLYDQISTSFNWLVATLFAANGGAVVALVSRDTLVSALPLALFAGGVVCSILMGFCNAAYAAKAIIPTTDIRMTIALISAGLVAPQQLQEKTSQLDELTWLKWPMYGSGIL